MEQTPQNQLPAVIQPQAPIVTFVQVPARVIMFNITEQELDSIAAASPQTELALFGVAFGAFVAFLTVLLTVQLGAYLMAIFVALTVTSFALSLFFGVAACKAMSAIRANLQNIKNRRM